MNIRFPSRFTLALFATLDLALPAYAQIAPADPNIPVIENPSYIVTWIVAVLFVVGIFAVAFKNAKRTHLD